MESPLPLEILLNIALCDREALVCMLALPPVAMAVSTYKNYVMDRFTRVKHKKGYTKYLLGKTIHREGGPAIEYNSGTKIWAQYGKLHRDSLPAIMLSNGINIWYREGKIHRDDGPAIKFPDGKKLYYNSGIEVDKMDIDRDISSWNRATSCYCDVTSIRCSKCKYWYCIWCAKYNCSRCTGDLDNRCPKCTFDIDSVRLCNQCICSDIKDDMIGYCYTCKGIVRTYWHGYDCGGNVEKNIDMLAGMLIKKYPNMAAKIIADLYLFCVKVIDVY